ncbi:MAG: sigma 54-interacting transcriptional regulator [Dethiosulfatibacter sp.]|nr:sigma 54-interacting transcriptional regulator [Dethiosulfatibacter sp.]
MSKIKNENVYNQMQILFEKNPNGVIVTDKDNHILFVNQNAQKFFDDNESCIIGKELFSSLPLFQQVDLKNRVNYSFLRGELQYEATYFEINYHNLDANVYLINLLVKEEYSENDLKCKQEIIDELYEILEGSYDGILVTDNDGKILFVNKSYERVAAIKREDMWGKNMRDLINPVWMPNAVSFVVAEQKQVISKKQVTKDGRNIIVTGTPIFNKKGEIKKIVINARDITKIYELREELIRERHLNHTYLENYNKFIEKNPCDPQSMLAVSKPMQEIYELVKKIANFQATVLILGESGVGKELVAQCIHDNSIRKNKQFIIINCGAIPENLLESELFGYEKGAFTGANQYGKSGLLEIADGGTVFLDEIGEMSLDLQVKLLRFLETKEIRKVGGTLKKIVDIRVIAATNRDLDSMVEEGTFREDLFYRLNVVRIKVPPLRKRIADITPLSMMFLVQYNKKYNQSKEFTIDVISEFEKYKWPGNVRELKNVIENMVTISNNEYLQINDIPWKKENNTVRKIINLIDNSEDLTLVEATEILEKLMLEREKPKYQTTRSLAERMGVDQSTIVRKLKKYGL